MAKKKNDGIDTRIILGAVLALAAVVALALAIQSNGSLSARLPYPSSTPRLSICEIAYEECQADAEDIWDDCYNTMAESFNNCRIQANTPNSGVTIRDCLDALQVDRMACDADYGAGLFECDDYYLECSGETELPMPSPDEEGQGGF